MVVALVDVAERFVLSPGQILVVPVTDGVPIVEFTVTVALPQEADQQLPEELKPLA